MNRQQRRKAQKRGIIARPNESTFRLKYDLNVPGDNGKLRSEHPARFAGVIEAENEADLLRGIFSKMCEAYGYAPHRKAVAGVVGDMFGPMGKNLRGQIAIALIGGQGLYVAVDEEEVCVVCGATRESRLHPDPENSPCPGDEPCVREPDGSHHEDCPPFMLDTTVHSDVLHAEGPSYKQEEVILLVNPQRYEPLADETEIPTGMPEEPSGDVSIAPTEVESEQEGTDADREAETD